MVWNTSSLPSSELPNFFVSYDNYFGFTLISLNNFPDVVAQVDCSGRVLFINEQVEKLTGSPPSFYIDKYFQELDFPAEIISLWERNFSEVMNSGKAKTFEFRVDTLRGNILVECRLVPEKNNDNKTLLAIIRNITSEVSSPGKIFLNKQDEKLQNLFEILPVGVTIIDNNKSVIEMNDSLIRILDISRDGLLKGDYKNRIYLKSDGTQMPPEEMPSFRALTEKKVIHDVETGIVKENGEVVWVSVSAAPLSSNKCLVVTADITAVKKSEMELEELVKKRTEQLLTGQNLLRKFQAAIEQSPASIIITDRNGNIEYVNPKFTKITGYALQEAVGKNPRILKSGRTSRITYKHLWDSISHGREWHGSLLNKNKRGDLYWESISISPVYNINGEITHFVGVKEDITLRKKQEEALYKLNRTLNALKHIGQAILQAVSEEEFMQQVCNIIVDTCAYDLARVILPAGGRKKSVLPSASAGKRNNITLKIESALDGPVLTALRTGQTSWFSIKEKNPKSGLWREELVNLGYNSLLVLPLGNEENTFGVLSIYSKAADSFSDEEIALLTELSDDLAYGINVIRLRDAHQYAVRELEQHRDNLEKLVSERTAELAAANEILEEAQQVGHIGHWRLNIETQHLQWSNEVYRIFGTEPQSFGADLDSFLSFIHPEDREFVEKEYRDSVTNKTFYNIKHRIIRADGSVGVAHEQCTTHYDKKGKPLYSLGVVQDITEQDRAEKEIEIHRNHLEELVKTRTGELAVSNAKLKEEIEKEKQFEILLKESLEKEKELNELKSRFISTTSHEFRTPLTSILSSMQLIQRYRNKWGEEKIEDQFARVKNSIMYLTNLLEDILTISHADSGKIILKPQLIDLQKFCLEIIEEVRHKECEKHKFTFSYTAADKEFLLDPKLIRFIIVNLLSNAFKYSPDGGKVKLRISSSGEFIGITVTDEGIGILEEDKEHLFKPFYRSVNTGEIEGTGLGLSIVKRAVEIHNGSIKFNSRMPKGTRFIIRIPVKSYGQENISN